MEKISVVVSCYNEEESIPLFYNEIKKVMSIMKELRDITDSDHYFNYDLLNDEKIYEEFGKANTDGIFQFEAKDLQKD